MMRKWAKTSEIAEAWGFSRQHIWRLRHEMQAAPRFRDGIRGSRRGLRINEEIFDAFMAWRDTQKGARA